jgi:hypothetical protein
MKRREQEKKGGKERETGCGVVFIESVFDVFAERSLERWDTR